MKLAQRVNLIKPSPTLAITAKAKAMKAEGIDVVGFGAGEPDFDTPENIKEAAIKAIKEGFTKYTPVPGIDELKEAIIEKAEKEQGLKYDKSEVIVSCGAKHSLYNIAMALFEEGDEVIIPAPYWVTYPDQTVLSGAKPVFIYTKEENEFKVLPEELEEAITEKTKALILNYPSNPTGATYTKEELEALAEVILKKNPNMWVISDEVYEKILYDGRTHVSIATVSPEMKERTLLVNAVSKTYSMTGWRIGWVCGNKEVVAAMSKLQSQSTSNPTSIAQKAAVEALKGPQDKVYEMVKAFNERRDYIVERLNSIEGVSCFKPHGSFYVFPNFSGVYGKSYNGKVIEGSMDFAAYLLDEFKVAIVPGVAFGDDNCARLSYATSMENIKKGLDRIEEAINKLK
ncbi:MAG: pyridoxal phosphate-dependent aminotransferase [Deferribacteres bacterium]|nr:pyridoxal phosphate-dependent aminotransferase [Deferribacteres bacterium]